MTQRFQHITYYTHGAHRRDCVYDSDFGYDAQMTIIGDFPTLDEKIAYAKAVCNALNKADIPLGLERKEP